MSMNLLKWALIFLPISVAAGLMGFTEIAAGAAEIANVVFFICIALFLEFLVVGLLAAQKLEKSPHTGPLGTGLSGARRLRGAAGVCDFSGGVPDLPEASLFRPSGAGKLFPRY